MISMVDYGAGNVGSVIRMIEKVGRRAQRARTAKEINGADKLMLPGAGAFDCGMAQLAERGLVDVLPNVTLVNRSLTGGHGSV